MAGEDRSHIVLSDSRGFVFAAVLDGFAERHAVDFLLSRLYPALCLQLDTCGLHSLHPQAHTQEGSHAGGSAGGKSGGRSGEREERPWGDCNGRGVHAGGSDSKGKLGRMLSAVGRVSNRVFSREPSRDWSEFSDEAHGLQQDGSCDGPQSWGGGEASGEVRGMHQERCSDGRHCGHEGRGADEGMPGHTLDEALQVMPGMPGMPGHTLNTFIPSDCCSGDEAGNAVGVVSSEGVHVAGQGEACKEGVEWREGRGEEQGEGYREEVQLAQEQSQQQQQQQQQQHPSHPPKVIHEPLNDHRKHRLILGALERALASVESAFLTHVKDVSKEQPEYALGGASLVAAMVTGTDIYVINLGDSRAVILRGDEAARLTVDHNTSNADEVRRVQQAHSDADIMKKGRLKGKIKLTRAFGAAYLKDQSVNDALLGMFRVKYQASTSGSEPYLSTSPYLRHMRISPSDRLLILSSDGLYQHMQTRDVAKCLGPTLASFLPRPAASGSAHGGSGVSNLTRRLSLGGSIRFGSKKWMGKGVGEERGGWGRDGEGGTGGSGLAGSTSGGGGSDSAGVAVAAAGAAGETGGAWDQNGIGKSGSSTNSSTLQATSHSSSNTIISTASCTISQSTSNSTTSSSNIAQMLVRDALERAAKQAGTDPSSLSSLPLGPHRRKIHDDISVIVLHIQPPPV
ncbi:hypothetical protein CLOP_g13395 [Closterium sp. NIES-67]|nr:hypothetical protein CLOP_g13395 [Closterium sp. NIES-67]